jgi:hypothetical protein
VATIENVRAYARRVNGEDLRSGPIPLHVMHDNDRTQRQSLRLQHKGRAVFDVAKWVHGNERFSLVDGDETLNVSLPVRESGLRLEIEIGGDNVPSVECWVIVSGSPTGGRPLNFRVIPVARSSAS